MDNLQKQLTRARVENENSAVDRLGGEVALERLMDGDSVNVRIIDEELNLVRKEF